MTKTFNTNKPKIDLSELFGRPQKQDERIFSKSAINIYEFYLTGDIESADEYIQWFDIIRHAGENDVLKFYINSYGGDVFTAIQFMKVLRETQATVFMAAEGACMSAATMIFLCGHSFQIADHSAFMIHTYSGGMIGKGHEMHSQAQYERAWSVDLIKQVYKGFLTDAELQKVIDGQDLWMDAGQVIKRLKARNSKDRQQEVASKKPQPKKDSKTSSSPIDTATN